MATAELNLYLGMNPRMDSTIPRAGLQCVLQPSYLTECMHWCGVLYLVWPAGGFEEASRRRQEAELSRAQLQQKIESLKQARNSTPRTGACLTLPTPPALSHTAAILSGLTLHGLY